MSRHIFLKLTVVLMLTILASCAGGMGRGSSRTLFSMLETVEVLDEDVGKDIQLRLDQKVLFKFKRLSPMGDWSVSDYEKRTLLLLTDSARVDSDCTGILFQARALGSGSVDLKFTPDDETQETRQVHFDISIRK